MSRRAAWRPASPIRASSGSCRRWTSSRTAAGTTTRARATTCSRHTDTEWAPWFVARSDDKKRVRLNIIKHILSSIPYEVVKQPKIVLPKRQKPGDYQEANLPLKYVPEVY
jgi:hypothetical protein